MAKHNDSQNSPNPFMFAENALVGTTDAVEWVIVHSYPESLSPPMLAMNWDQAQLLFNSMLDASLSALEQVRERAAVVCLENDKERLRLGIFTKFGKSAVPNQMILLMDRRSLTQELYENWYLDGRFNEDSKFVFDLIEPKKGIILH